MKRYEEIPHIADWSYRAFGNDLRELFANAAFALFALEGAHAQVSSPETARVVEANGIDRESLLVNWLTELLWLHETHHETYLRFAIETLTDTELRAHVFGAPLTSLDKSIKAVTYHNLEITQTTEGWQAVVVVDV